MSEHYFYERDERTGAVIAHALNGQRKGYTWDTHKYIAKIGDRYFYTQQQLKAFGQNAKRGITQKVKDVTGISARERRDQARADMERGKSAQTQARANMDRYYRQNQAIWDNFHRKGGPGDTYGSNLSKARDDLANKDQAYRTNKASRDSEIARLRSENDERRAKNEAYNREYDKYKANSNNRLIDRNEQRIKELEAQDKAERAEVAKAADRYKSNTEDYNNARNIRNKESDESINRYYNERDKLYEANGVYSKAKNSYDFNDAMYKESLAGRLESLGVSANASISSIRNSAAKAIESGKATLSQIMNAFNSSVSSLRSNAKAAIADGKKLLDQILGKTKEVQGPTRPTAGPTREELADNLRKRNNSWKQR